MTWIYLVNSNGLVLVSPINYSAGRIDILIKGVPAREALLFLLRARCCRLSGRACAPGVSNSICGTDTIPRITQYGNLTKSSYIKEDKHKRIHRIEDRNVNYSKYIEGYWVIMIVFSAVQSRTIPWTPMLKHSQPIYIKLVNYLCIGIG